MDKNGKILKGKKAAVARRSDDDVFMEMHGSVCAFQPAAFNDFVDVFGFRRDDGFFEA